MDSRIKADECGPKVEPWHLADSAFCGSVQCGGKTEYQVTIPLKAGSFWFDPCPSAQSAEGGLFSDTPCCLIGSDDSCKIVPCEEARGESILLITARSGFGGDFGTVTAVGADIISTWRSKRGTYRVMHILARVTTQDGYVMTETGFKSDFGLTEVYSWRGGYFAMPTPEYKNRIAAGTLFQDRDTIDDELTEIKQRRSKLEKSRKARWYCEPRLVKINEKYRKAGLKEPFVPYAEYFIYLGYTGLETPSYFLYERQSVGQLVSQTSKAFDLLASYQPCREDTKKMWEVQYRAVAAQYSFVREDQYGAGIVTVSYGDRFVTVRYEDSPSGGGRQTNLESKVTIWQYSYCQAGLEKFISAVDEYQERSRGSPV